MNFFELQRDYHRLILNLARKNRLTISEWLLLRQINVGGNTQVSLSKKLGIDVSTLCRQVGSLNEKGFVIYNKEQVVKKVRKRRAYEYQITDSGHYILAKMNDDYEKLVAKIFAQWSDEEREMLKILINRLTQRMKQVKI